MISETLYLLEKEWRDESYLFKRLLHKNWQQHKSSSFCQKLFQVKRVLNRLETFKLADLDGYKKPKELELEKLTEHLESLLIRYKLTKSVSC